MIKTCFGFISGILAVIVIFVAMPLVGSAAPKSPQELAEYADNLLLNAYRRRDVVAYCESNPASFYQIEVSSNGAAISLTIRCRSYHDWKELLAQQH